MNRVHETQRETGGVISQDDLARLKGLHETMIEIAAIAKTVDYRPNHSFDFHANVIEWAAEWEKAWLDGVAGGSWPEDEWIERTEDFALAKLREHSHMCRRWTETDQRVPVLPSMDAILPAGPKTEEADTFILDADGAKLASYGPRVLDGSGGTQCVIPAIKVVPQFWGIYRHDEEGFADCVGDAVDRKSAASLAALVAKDTLRDRTLGFRVKGHVDDGEQLYWSDIFGWCDRDAATVYPCTEATAIIDPLGSTGREEVPSPSVSRH
jgi:hypothetical protein